MTKFFQGLILALVAFSGAVLGAVVSTYFGPYLQSSMNQRDELANDLANFYSSGASEYYADEEVNSFGSNTDKSSAYYLELHKEEDQHYKEFLAASVKLASELPPGDLRVKVLGMDDKFSDISGDENTKNENDWFMRLDQIRNDILANTVFEKSLNPLWK